MTNYEKIKNMSIEEMALHISCPCGVNIDDYGCLEFENPHPKCVGCVKKWLESECLEQSVEKEIIEF